MGDSKSVLDSIDGAARKQKRSLLTRQNLLRSARAIFARDGFEQARIEDIAAEAGKTRGAFYDHFEDKEDVFFAIFEENIDRDMAELAPRLMNFSSIDLRIDALAEYLSEVSKDGERILLNLEFKLYAIRHPQRRKRLADLHAQMCLTCCIPELGALLPQILKNSESSQLLHSLVIGGIVDGFSLNHLFNPEGLNDQEVARYLKLCLRETLKETSLDFETGIEA